MFMYKARKVRKWGLGVQSELCVELEKHGLKRYAYLR